MQWTPFGRIGADFDAIPRAKLSSRAGNSSGAGSEFERNVSEFREANLDETPARTDEAVTPKPKPDEARAETPAHEREGPSRDTSSSSDPKTNATAEPAPSETAKAPVRAEVSAAAPERSTAARSLETPTMTAPSSTAVVKQAPTSAAPAALSLTAAAARAKGGPVAVADARGPGTAQSVHVAKTAKSAPVRQTMPAILTEEQHRTLIRRIALAATETGGEMRMLLEPANLGALGVRLRLNGSELKLELRAERNEVVALLDRDVARLQLELRDRGLDVQDIDIGMSSREDQRRAQHEFEHGHERTSPDDRYEIPENANENGTGSANAVPEAQDTPDSLRPDVRIVLDTIA